MSAAAGVGATNIANSLKLAKYLGVPCVPEPLNSDIKLVSLFSKKVLTPPEVICSTDLNIKESDGMVTALFPAVNVEVAYFLKSS